MLNVLIQEASCQVSFVRGDFVGFVNSFVLKSLNGGIPHPVCLNILFG